MGLDVTEDESHMLFHCDLYTEQRSKLLANLNKSPQLSGVDSTTSTTNFDLKNLKMHLMPLLSPNVPESQAPSSNLNIHSHSDLNIASNTPAFTLFEKKRSYVINCVCTFILRCIERRWNFLDDYRKSVAHANTITFNILRH